MRQLRHLHLRLMPDFGKMTGDIYAGREAMLPCDIVVSAKTHEFDAAGNQIDFDYFWVDADRRAFRIPGAFSP